MIPFSYTYKVQDALFCQMEKQYVLHKNVGRCLQFLPDRKSVSYVARTQSGNELYQLQLKDLHSGDNQTMDLHQVAVELSNG